MTQSPPPGTLLVEGAALSKSFGGVRALDNASFAAAAGEVHALVGENGAGKSTLIKILGGRLQADSGTVRINNQPAHFTGPEQAHARGAWTVFQELMLFPGMTVAENLLLGNEPRGSLGVISHRRMGRQADALLAGMGITHIDPLALVEDTSLAQRQIVEIVRALSHQPEILFLDEPTSSLVEREVLWLFDRIRALRDRGACVIFTSHRWNEVHSIADRITVFRNGRDVGTFTELDANQAVTLMTGQHLETLFPPRPPAPERMKDSPPPPFVIPAKAGIHSIFSRLAASFGQRFAAGSVTRSPTGNAALQLDSLSGPRVHQVSLTLRPGEILGIGGLAGQGHRELFFLLFGAQRQTGGRIIIGGRAGRIRSPREAKRRPGGLALVPEDRKTEGLLLGMSVRDNLTLSVLDRASRFGVLRRPLERRLAQGMVRQLAVRTAGIGTPVGTLSGGNQQKVLLGRWLLTEPHVLLLYDVTRGVDVATKHEIYQLIVRLAAEGRAILFYSSDAEELASLSHRVLVMREGRIAAQLTAPEITAEQIVAAAVHERIAA